jgi:hypothetical protein
VDVKVKLDRRGLCLQRILLSQEFFDEFWHGGDYGVNSPFARLRSMSENQRPRCPSVAKGEWRSAKCRPALSSRP